MDGERIFVKNIWQTTHTQNANQQKRKTIQQKMGKDLNRFLTKEDIGMTSKYQSLGKCKVRTQSATSHMLEWLKLKKKKKDGEDNKQLELLGGTIIK